MPPPISRIRSRRARSSGGTSSSPAVSRVAGSATSRSAPPATSSTHNALTGSVPLAERRNTTRAPAAPSVTLRGRPRVKLRVRAAWRGKERGCSGCSVTRGACHRTSALGSETSYAGWRVDPVASYRWTGGVSGRPATAVHDLGLVATTPLRRRAGRRLVGKPVAEGDRADGVDVVGDAEGLARGPVVLRRDAEEAGAEPLVDGREQDHQAGHG